MAITFKKDFKNGDLDAEIAVGSKTATFAASRGASNPATYIDVDGVIQQTTTSDEGRFTYGYYDESGFHRWSHGKVGLMIESASTNLWKTSIFNADGNSDGVADNWGSPISGVTASLEDASALTNISGAQIQKITLDGTQANFYQVAQAVTVNPSTTYTFSVWIKATNWHQVTNFILVELVKSGGAVNSTANISYSSNDDPITFGWRRYTITTTTDADQDNISVRLGRETGNGGTGTLEFFGAQIEQSPFATSFIPTTTASLTRNKETLKYENSGNRTAAVESCVTKLSVERDSTVTSLTLGINDTDTKRRYFRVITNNDVGISSNYTDSSASAVTDIINEAWTANQQMTLGYNIQHSSPYIVGYYQGIVDGTSETIDDFIDPNWGTYFWVGSDSSEISQLNGTIFSVEFWNKVLTAGEMLDEYKDSLYNSGYGKLHSVNISSDTDVTITIYDNIEASGTIVYKRKLDVSVEGLAITDKFNVPVTCSTGLYVDRSHTNCNVTVDFRRV